MQSKANETINNYKIIVIITWALLMGQALGSLIPTCDPIQ